MDDKPLGQRVGRSLGRAVQFTLAHTSEGLAKARSLKRQLRVVLTPQEERLCRRCSSFDPAAAAEVFQRYPAFMSAAAWLEPGALVGGQREDTDDVVRWADAGVCHQCDEVRFAGDSCEQWDLRT